MEEEKKSYCTPRGDVYLSDAEWQEGRRKFAERYPTVPLTRDLEQLDVEVSPEMFERIMNSEQEAYVMWETDANYDKVIDENVVAASEPIFRKRDVYFADWAPVYANDMRKVLTIKFTCGDQSVVKEVEEQGWTFPETDTIGDELAECYGCYDVLEWVENNLTEEAQERKLAAGVPFDEVFAEWPAYFWFTFPDPENEVFYDDEEDDMDIFLDGMPVGEA